MKNPKQLVSEIWANWDVSRSSWFGPTWNALRGMIVESFFKKPIMSGSTVNYDLARALYRNADDEYRYGAGFVRPIIDLSVEYMGLPSFSGTENDVFLNECVADYWAAQLQEMFRDSMRDSKVYVRYRQPSALNPLSTEADRVHGKLEIVPPESVEVTFDPSDPDMVERAVFTHFIDIDARSDQEIVSGTAPRLETHELLEIVTPEEYRWYDKTAGKWLDTWRTPNTWRFVALWTSYNDYASDLGGGQSDIEPVLSFIKAFHEVLQDTLVAHKYHSIPKVKFNVKDVGQFIANNFPNAIDPETKRPKVGAKINLSGREVYFFNADEDGSFIEATSVLGDSKTLLEFLIECIAIASETPRWALLAHEGVLPETDASVQPFEKKIARKRTQFAQTLVVICKMALKATGKMPTTPRVSWPPIRTSDLVNKGQAIQQLILGFDVASQHEWLSDRTIVQILGTLFDEISDPDAEMEAAKDNVIPEVPAPAPASETQGPQSNGSGSKKTAKRALAITKASNS